MKKRPRIETIFKELATKQLFKEKLEELEKSFKPFKSGLKTIGQFEEWVSELFNSSNQPKKEEAFKENFISICDYLIVEEKLFVQDIGLRIIEYFLFKELPVNTRFFGISHYIDTDVDDSGKYAKLEILIDPGVNQDEVIDYIKSFWSNWKEVWEKQTWEDDRLLKKIRIKNNLKRNEKIRELKDKGYNLKQISTELIKQGIKVTYVNTRKITSNQNRKKKI